MNKILFEIMVALVNVENVVGEQRGSMISLTSRRRRHEIRKTKLFESFYNDAFI